MSFRIVQRGEGPLVVGFLISPTLDDELRRALPGRAIAATLDGGVRVTPSEVRAAAVAAGLRSDAEIAAFGYSAGCQGVRKLLVDGVRLVAAVCIDGTAGSIPPAKWQLDVWRDMGARARAGEALFVATCTQQTYVETLPPKSRFASTVRILEESLGLALRVESDRPPSGLSNGKVTGLPAESRVGVDIREGGLRVISYASASMDHAEHAAQLTNVLPYVLEVELGPYLAGRFPLRHDTEPAPPPASFTITLDPEQLFRGLDYPLGMRILAVLGHELGIDPRELAGTKHHERILLYGGGCMRGGEFLGVDREGRPLWSGDARPVGARTDEEPWCAKLRSFALLRALREGEKPPHGLRVSVAEQCADARAAGRLALAGGGYEPSPGDAAILGRDGGNPLLGGPGHIRTCVQNLGNGSYVGLGGNEENRIVVANHHRRDVLAWIIS